MYIYMYMLWACSKNVKAVLLTVSVLFLSSTKLSLSGRNKITGVLITVQLWRVPIANHSKTTIDKNTSKPLTFRSFLLTKL